ncbi:oligosaccharyl transferase subunit ost3/OST6 [Ceratobasidium sp. 395]|nr:oligosaccharyl transferase subunit ost3/OST6 [Ceratobasidium sp. 395]
MIARFLTLLALPLACLANPTQQKLVSLAAKGGGIIKLDSALYDTLTASDREWSAVVQLTAMGEQFKCAPCKEFNPNFNAVAKAWHSKIPEDKRDTHFFATLDFADGRDVFARLGLSSAPFVNFFPIEKGPNKKPGKQSTWTYDFNSLSFDPSTFSRELSKHTIVPVPYTTPPNYAFMANIAAVVLLGGLAARFAYTYLGDFIFSRWTWALGVVLTMLTFTSGYMFVKIRGMPMTVRGQWMAGGYQNQYGMETNVVSIIYGTLAFAQLMLILGVPRAKSAGSQRFSIYIFSVMVIVVFSMLVSLFRLKNPSYPFRMLF